MAGVMDFHCSKHLNTSHLPSITERVMYIGILRGKTATHWITDTCHMLHVTCYIMLPTFIQIKQTDQNKCCDEINDTQTHTPCAHANYTHTHTHTHTCVWLPWCTPTNTCHAVSFMGFLDNVTLEDPQMCKIEASQCVWLCVCVCVRETKPLTGNTTGTRISWLHFCTFLVYLCVCSP